MKGVKVGVAILLGLAMAGATRVCAQVTTDPFPAPIEATRDAITVNYVEFARLPASGADAPRMMLLLDEPATSRFFVITMAGSLFSISHDGKTVAPYLDISDPKWGVPVQADFAERGVQSFAIHPQFAVRGARGFGKFYTYLDTSNIAPRADFIPLGNGHSHDTVLLEWTANDPSAAVYDGGPPRELFRAQQPFPNHNGGMIAFNPLTTSDSAEFGLLYVGLADGGSGGDPYNMAQNLSSAFGKVLRIDPLGGTSANGQYGVPRSNPFASDGRDETLGEIYASGVRNPQRFSWDAKTGVMYLADIGQNFVEEISPVSAGANLGWNIWEGSYLYGPRELVVSTPRGDTRMTYPVVEFDHRDPLLTRPAVTGVYVYRQDTVPALTNKLIFGDNPSGEIFYVDADALPSGGHDRIRRILFNDMGEAKTLLQLIRERSAASGRRAPRADMRLGIGSSGRLFVLNKHDGIIRELVR
jgi:hypothetical protein